MRAIDLVKMWASTENKIFDLSLTQLYKNNLVPELAELKVQEMVRK